MCKTLFIILILLYFTFKIKRTKDAQLALMKQNLLKVELKTNQLVNEALNKELEIKKNKLSDFTKTLIERSEIITELKSQLEKWCWQMENFSLTIIIVEVLGWDS